MVDRQPDSGLTDPRLQNWDYLIKAFDAEANRVINVDSSGDFYSASNPNPVEEVNKLTITNSLEETAYDLNAAPYSGTTNISSSYTLSGIVLDFTTEESKTITLTDSQGTVLWTLENNTNKNVTKNLCQGFSADDNLTLTITQTSGACLADIKLKTETGSAILSGNPILDPQSQTQIVGANGVPVCVDETNCSLASDPHEELMINAGTHYFVRDVYEFTNSDPVYFMFRTPNTATRINAFVEMTSEAEFTAQILEGGSVSADGTPVTPVNNDRDSTNTAELEPYANPTVTDDGTQIIKFKVGEGKTSGVNAFHHKIKAKTNTIYLFKLVSEEGARWIDIDFYWYENS